MQSTNDKENNRNVEKTHGLPRTPPVTFFIHFSFAVVIVIHRSLLRWWCTRQGSSEGMTGLSKKRPKKPENECCSAALTKAQTPNNVKDTHLFQLEIPRSLDRSLFTVRSRPARPGQLKNKAKRQSLTDQDSFHSFGGERERRPPLPEIIRSSYPHLG